MDPEATPARRREAMIQLLRVGGVGAAAAGLGVWLNGRGQHPAAPAAENVRLKFEVPADLALPEMVVVQCDDPARMVRRAIQELGGIRRFISRGDVVVIKPNAAWDRTVEQAANTNPLVDAEAARLCPEARLFREVDLRGDVLTSWPVLGPFLSADKMINLPIAKHHSLTGASLGMKNWYGILGGPRQRLHQQIHESLVDLADFMRPTLTVIDAFRVLLRNGPGGGNPADVALQRTLIAGTDPVALDAYAAKAYWDLDWHTLRYLKLASERHLGTLSFEAVRTRFVAL